jgi:pyruvate dehydrogenase E1 component alpha subunit
VVLVCNNNSWALSTPTAEQSGAEQLVDKALGYGMPGVRVDGADVLAVRAAVHTAAAAARAGEGPQFIEVVTYRGAPHATADEPGRYVDPDEVRTAREGECLGRFEHDLLEMGALSETAIRDIRDEALGEMRAAIDAVECLPAPDPRLVFDTTYASPPSALREARASALGR